MLKSEQELLDRDSQRGLFTYVKFMDLFKTTKVVK